ncbi:hypothetical protein, conserved [Trypanosoma brucei brucei TREU927]|uniref:Uncharacterized protein n=1 Tax=Trypanosoma brucei brucei (strain 927/4 GUTat10.1) TaxID=185431 RepID=Q57XU2_TRYB2|nr:hypothetical protein, conserved [Trypanosoma brucei brucei TREU927]AAX69577.1 hypothetical protein, conserved [Trypanosoma brucei]AAZ12783.1 hypothetical protein, conserved [Trypanosoma brucei brucei TREU927]
MSTSSSIFFEVDTEGNEAAEEEECHSLREVPNPAANTNAVACNTSDDVMAAGGALYRPCVSALSVPRSSSSGDATSEEMQQDVRLMLQRNVGLEIPASDQNEEQSMSWVTAETVEQMTDVDDPEGTGERLRGQEVKVVKDLKRESSGELKRGDGREYETESDTDLAGISRPHNHSMIADKVNALNPARSPRFLPIPSGNAKHRDIERGNNSLSVANSNRSGNNNAEQQVHSNGNNAMTASTSPPPKASVEGPASAPAEKGADAQLKREKKCDASFPQPEEAGAVNPEQVCDQPAIPVHPSAARAAPEAKQVKQTAKEKKKGGFFKRIKGLFSCCGTRNVVGKNNSKELRTAGGGAPIAASGKAERAVALNAAVAEGERGKNGKAGCSLKHEHDETTPQGRKCGGEHSDNEGTTANSNGKDRKGEPKVSRSKHDGMKPDGITKEAEKNIGKVTVNKIAERGATTRAQERGSLRSERDIGLKGNDDGGVDDTETDCFSTIPNEEQDSFATGVLPQPSAQAAYDEGKNSGDARRDVSDTLVGDDVTDETLKERQKPASESEMHDERDQTWRAAGAGQTEDANTDPSGAFSPQSISLCPYCNCTGNKQCNCRRDGEPGDSKGGNGSGQAPPVGRRKPRPKWSIGPKKDTDGASQVNKESNVVRSGGGSYVQLAEKRREYLKNTKRGQQNIGRVRNNSSSKGTSGGARQQAAPMQQLQQYQLDQTSQQRSLKHTPVQQQQHAEGDGSETGNRTPVKKMADEERATCGSRSATPPRLPPPKNIPEFMNSLKTLDNAFNHLNNPPKLPCSSEENFSWEHFKKHFYLAGQQFPSEVMNDEELREVLADLSTKMRPSCSACRSTPSELWLLELLTGVKSSQLLVRLEKKSLYETPAETALRGTASRGGEVVTSAVPASHEQ